MSDTVVQITGLGKKYCLGQHSGGTGSYRRFSEAMLSSVRRPFGWLHGQADIRGAAESNEFWALRDVSFDIRRGEVMGIIGRNGSGKSTLLKLLSRITPPTTGRIELDGRVASLLEVGTGFHPELTGRENVFLNGAILGMTRSEVRRKFDEIVEFAEVSKFIDTPVKRYSSGMYVRLAFAVAAHLEPDILIVDEVLAVGDVQFQRKCIGKMGEIAGQQGRTVLFVSHNLGTVGALCNRAVLLREGRAAHIDTTNAVISDYLAGFKEDVTYRTVFEPDLTKPVGLTSVRIEAISPTGNTGMFSVTDKIRVTIDYVVNEENRGVNLGLTLKRNGSPLMLSFDTDTAPGLQQIRTPGRYQAALTLPSILKAGSYSIDLNIGYLGIGLIENRPNALSFDLEELSIDYSAKSHSASRVGEIACSIDWNTARTSDHPTDNS